MWHVSKVRKAERACVAQVDSNTRVTRPEIFTSRRFNLFHGGLRTGVLPAVLFPACLSVRAASPCGLPDGTKNQASVQDGDLLVQLATDRAAYAVGDSVHFVAVPGYLFINQ